MVGIKLSTESFDDLVVDLIATMRHLRTKKWGAELTSRLSRQEANVMRVVRPQDGAVLEVQQFPRVYKDVRVTGMAVEFDCIIEKKRSDNVFSMGVVSHNATKRLNYDRVSIEIAGIEPFDATIHINDQLLKIVEGL